VPSTTPAPPVAAPRATPVAWARAVVGLALGVLPGVALLPQASGAFSSDGYHPILMAAVALYYLSLPLAAWQFRRPVRPGQAWGYVAGVILVTVGGLAALVVTALLHWDTWGN
jgi:hypothetical protein